jgi:hypothetical protein
MSQGKVLLGVLLCAFIIGCAAKEAPIISNIPASSEATIIESTNPAEVMVSARGIGTTTDEALLDARKAAIAVVLNGGSDPLLQTPAEKAQFEFIQENFYSPDNISRFISWESNQAMDRVRLEGGRKIKITKSYKVNKRILQEDMEKRGIIKERVEITEAIGLPMIMVIPEAPRGQSPIEAMSHDPTLKHAAQVIESYLTNRRYDVQVPEQSVTLDELTGAQQAIKGMEEDYSYQLALTVGSDIYITYTVDIQSREIGGSIVRKAIVGARAYETTTARLLGTETGYSEERPTPDLVVIEEAMHGAIDNVLSRVNAYWKDDLKRGVQYKLIISIEGGFDDDTCEDIAFAISRSIKQSCKSYKENIAADRTMDYIVWVDSNQISDSRELYATLRQEFSANFPTATLRSININRKLVLLRIIESS